MNIVFFFNLQLHFFLRIIICIYSQSNLHCSGAPTIDGQLLDHFEFVRRLFDHVPMVDHFKKVWSIELIGSCCDDMMKCFAYTNISVMITSYLHFYANSPKFFFINNTSGSFTHKQSQNTHKAQAVNTMKLLLVLPLISAFISLIESLPISRSLTQARKLLSDEQTLEQRLQSGMDLDAMLDNYDALYGTIQVGDTFQIDNLDGERVDDLIYHEPVISAYDFPCLEDRHEGYQPIYRVISRLPDRIRLRDPLLEYRITIKETEIRLYVRAPDYFDEERYAISDEDDEDFYEITKGMFKRVLSSNYDSMFSSAIEVELLIDDKEKKWNANVMEVMLKVITPLQIQIGLLFDCQNKCKLKKELDELKKYYLTDDAWESERFEAGTLPSTYELKQDIIFEANLQKYVSHEYILRNFDTFWEALNVDDDLRIYNLVGEDGSPFFTGDDYIPLYYQVITRYPRIRCVDKNWKFRITITEKGIKVYDREKNGCMDEDHLSEAEEDEEESHVITSADIGRHW